MISDIAYKVITSHKTSNGGAEYLQQVSLAKQIFRLHVFYLIWSTVSCILDYLKNIFNAFTWRSARAFSRAEATCSISTAFCFMEQKLYKAISDYKTAPWLKGVQRFDK